MNISRRQITAKGAASLPTYKDMIRSGRDFLRFLAIAVAAISFFSFFSTAAVAVDVTLGWDPNLEADLEGYAIYVKRDSVPRNKDLYGHLAVGDLADPSNPVETISGLEPDRKYFIALKAYDKAGQYSEFSSAICIQLSGDTVDICTEGATSDPNNSSESGSGGGGGGCFITSISDAAPLGVLFLFVSALLMIPYNRP
jgi:hypothetical protein